MLGTTITHDNNDLNHVSNNKIEDSYTATPNPNYFGRTPGGYLGEKFCLKPGHYMLKITEGDIAVAARAKVMPAAAVEAVFNDPEPLSLAQPDVHPLKPYYWVFPEASRTAVEKMLTDNKLVTFANMAAANPDHIDVDNSP